MDPATKKALIVLILVVIVFAGVFAWSATRADGDGGLSAPPWLAGLGGRLTSQQPVRASEIWGGCWNNSVFTVPAGSACEAVIKSADATLRTLRVRMVAGLRGRVQVTPRGENGVAASIPLRTETPQTPELQVMQEGASLTIRCEVAPPGAPACRFALAQK